MDPTEFNDVYHNDVLDKFSNENKTVVLKGNFKIDLFKYDSNIGSSTFQDKIYSIFLLLYISSPPPHLPILLIISWNSPNVDMDVQHIWVWSAIQTNRNQNPSNREDIEQ